MCTSTVEVAEALPVQPEIVIVLFTVVLSGIATSVPLVPVQPPPAPLTVRRERGGVGRRRRPCR